MRLQLPLQRKVQRTLNLIQVKVLKKTKLFCVRSVKKGFSFNAHRAKCIKCKEVFHFKCIDVAKEDYFKMKSSWLCSNCNLQDEARSGNASRPLTPLSLNVDKTDKEQPSMALILSELKAFRAEVHQTNREFEINMTKYSEWLTEQGNKIDNISVKLTAVSEDILAIKQENVNLKKQVNDLTMKVNFLEQATKENVVEIHGVPYHNQENIMDLLNKLSSAVGFSFNENMVDNCFRYKVNNKPGNIVVRFVRKMDMEKLIEKRKKKVNLNSRDLGFMEGNATAIYINYSLTQVKRKLLNAAKAMKKDKHYTFLWVKNGRIFLRKNPGDRFITIDSEEDLKKVL